MSINLYPSVDEFRGWKRADVIKFIKGKKEELDLDLDDEDIGQIEKNKVSGDVLLGLSYEELLVRPYDLFGGPAKIISGLIKDIKGEGQGTTASNQELQELKEQLALLQASKVKEEETIRLSSEGWEDFTQLYTRLKEAFDLRGSLTTYKFSISNKLIDLSWSKSVFIDYIEKQKCLADNLIIISGKKKVKRSYFDMINSLPAPSKLGEPEEWYKRQKTNAVDAICLNHCPSTASSSVPVSLLCSVFGKFKDLCDELSESKDNLFAYDFCIEMAKHYNYESVCQTTANKMLSEYLKRSVQPIVTEDNCCTDGTVCYGDGPNAYREVNVEYKKHNCSSEACPYLENCGYYLIFCAEKEEHSSYHVTNFPCFLIVISGIVINLVDMSLSEFATNFTFLGPYFFVSGAVFANVAIQKYDEAMMVSIAKTFRALKISLRLLDQYYANVDELIQDEPQTVHPVHPSFPEVIIDNKSYMVQIDSQVSTNLLWEVTLLNEQGPHLTAYVKAVKKDRYSLDTHKLLAEVGYAPEVYTTSIIPRNWILVYMEYLNNHSILNNIISNLDDQKRSSLRKKIKGIVEYLHNLGYIYEDLREGNILVYQLEGNEFDVKLIDFEWSGKVGSACYSPFMNCKTIQWPDGAEDWKLVTKNHDLFMLKQTFRKKNLL
ncbi:6414_t:CDS:2 [Gigaspora margarita]|uniref:6414_t:CDS:1 n=1 Tax=Gigaspora margarita TaxID=4874 RepID=A0ABN7VYA0_GIGMA|nr:6414_t:CDS:2 [Gigaspora margarita]